MQPIVEDDTYNLVPQKAGMYKYTYVNTSRSVQLALSSGIAPGPAYLMHKSNSYDYTAGKLRFSSQYYSCSRLRFLEVVYKPPLTSTARDVSGVETMVYFTTLTH